MLALSRTTGYAILALARLQGPGGPLTLAKDLASSGEIPRAYLSTILNALARHGLIKAKRGYRGGFMLARPAREISVFQVVEAVEGGAWREGCLLGLSGCSDDRACPCHAFWKSKRDQIEQFLNVLSLAEVAAFEARRGPRTEPSADRKTSGAASRRGKATTRRGRKTKQRPSSR